MRIALATRHLSDSTSTSAFGGLSRALAKRGHSVVLLTQTAPARGRFPASLRMLSGRDLAGSFDLALKRGEFDHIHLRIGGAHQNPLIRGLDAFAAIGKAGISVQFDDFDNPDLPKEDARTASALGRLLRGRARVSAISTAVRERVRKRWHLPASRIPVIPTGIDLGRETSPPGRDILCIGRLSPYKGLDLVLFAFAGLSRSFKDKLVFTGYGTKDRYLAELAKRLGIADRVRLLGPVSHSQVRRLLEKASFLVMGSRWDSLGLSAIEAMAAGRAVVAPRLGGFLDFVEHGRNGLFFEPEDPASLERAIRFLIENPARAASMGRKSLRTARRYEWPAIARRYLSLWT